MFLLKISGIQNIAPAPAPAPAPADLHKYLNSPNKRYSTL